MQDTFQKNGDLCGGMKVGRRMSRGEFMSAMHLKVGGDLHVIPRILEVKSQGTEWSLLVDVELSAFGCGIFGDKDRE